VTAILLAAATAYGTGFSVPVPANFEEAGGEERASPATGEARMRGASEAGAAGVVKREGGVLLQQQIPPPLPQVATANVIVTAVKPGDLESARPAVCERLSKRWVKDGATLQKQGVVPTPWGPACEVIVQASKKGPNAVLRVTIAAAKGKYSTITCNYDQRDEAAQQACDAVVADFHLD